jgi:hypothetical protein
MTGGPIVGSGGRAPAAFRIGHGGSPTMDLMAIFGMIHSLLQPLTDLIPAEAQGALEALRGLGPPM